MEDKILEQDLSVDEIKKQLGKILASSFFSQSERQSRFLRYIIDQTLSGNAERLKGYTIGIEVFDRDSSFDPVIDSIVRVEAGRLRSKLREYYHAEGMNDAILIDLPKGKYEPVFRNLPDERGHQVEPGLAAFTTIVQKDYRGNSVAVLPLRSLSPEPDQDYFSDGMTDAIITALAKNRQLKVISLTSVMRYKNTSKPIKEIADELNVSHIVEGTVTRDGNNIRITGQLIESRTDFHVWCENFERKLNNIFDLQREVATSIAACLTREIGNKADVTGSTLSINPEAYEAYLLGRRTRSLFTRESFYKAADYFKQAITIEPDYAAAYSGMASCYCGLGSHGFELECPIEIIPQGLEYADRAIALDSTLVDPHTYKGIMKLKYEWDWKGAEACFREALSISPNDARAHLQYSMYFESLGEFDRAINEAEQAKNVDPLSKEANMNLAWQYYQANKLTEARICLDHLLKLEPDFWGAYWDIAHIHLARSEFDEAIQAFRKSDESKGGHFMPLHALGYAYAMSGRKDDALAVIKKLDEIRRDNYVSPYYYATIYLGLGDIDRAFEYLEKAFEVRSRSLVWINVARPYTPLKNDRRFRDLVRRIGIPTTG